MKISAVLFALSLGLCLLLGIALMTEEPAGGHGVPHPDFPTMLQGGDISRHDTTLWLGWVMGVVILAFFVGLLAFGTRGRGSFPTESRVLVIGLIAFIGVFSAMVFTYAAEINPIILGFPLPTSLMFYGVGGVPVVFILLYMLRFDPWVLTDEQLDEFRRRFGEGGKD